MDQFETLVRQEVARQEKATKAANKRVIMGVLLASYPNIMEKDLDSDTLKSLIDRAETIADKINERV